MHHKSTIKDDYIDQLSIIHIALMNTVIIPALHQTITEPVKLVALVVGTKVFCRHSSETSNVTVTSSKACECTSRLLEQILQQDKLQKNGKIDFYITPDPIL